MSERTVNLGAEDVKVRLERKGSTFTTDNEGSQNVIEILSMSSNEAELLINGTRRIVPWYAEGEIIQFLYLGETYRAEVTTASGRKRPRHQDHSMSAPMPGIVLKISAAPGDEVRKGQTLVVLEAMKMEHQIVAPHDGKIAAVHCRAGEMVQPGVDLITMEKAPE